jgi:hypothetical protein
MRWVGLMLVTALAACGGSTEPPLLEVLSSSYRLTGFDRSGTGRSFILPALRSHDAVTGERTLVTAGFVVFPSSASAVEIHQTLQDYTRTGTVPFRTREARATYRIIVGDGTAWVIDTFTPDTLARIERNANGPGIVYQQYAGKSLVGLYRFER